MVHGYPEGSLIVGGITQLEMVKVTISRLHCFIIKFQPFDQEPKWQELAWYNSGTSAFPTVISILGINEGLFLH